MSNGNVGRIVAAAMVGLVVLATACASESEATSVPTAPVTTQGAPALAVDKLRVDLGTVAQDSVGTLTFLLMNRGTQLLRVGPVDLQVEQGCDRAEVIAGTAEMNPGEVALLPIKLGQHEETGPHRLLINVSSNDPARPVMTMSVRFDVAESAVRAAAGPRLQVDKTVIDIGTVPYDWPLYEQFTLRNVGDAPLVLEGTPVVRVEEGCWPPEAVVGSTTLQPGELTVLELPLFMGMHIGMDEAHVFAVDVKTNDPVEPVKTLRWYFTSRDIGWKTWMNGAVGAPTSAQGGNSNLEPKR